MKRRAAPRPSPKADVRKTVTALVSSAAAGRHDLSWLDAAILKAGYVAKSDALSKADARAVCKQISQALIDAESSARDPCCKGCLQHAIDTLSTLVASE